MSDDEVLAQRLAVRLKPVLEVYPHLLPPPSITRNEILMLCDAVIRLHASGSREQGLEEAAKVCDAEAAACDAGWAKSGGGQGYAEQAEAARECAASIRSLLDDRWLILDE